MELQRIKSIDIFRGLCMAWMVLAHLIDWWLKVEDSWLHGFMIRIIDPIGASGFLFISGISIALSYRKRLIKVETSKNYNYRMVRNSYLFRALFIFIIAIIYNSTIAIRLNDPKMIWTWFILLTAAVSLFMAWPLLKTPRFFRIVFGVLILIANQFILTLLSPYEGNSNIFGLFFHILYNDKNQDPILIFFPFFLFGTVIGDTIFNTFRLNDGSCERKTFQNKLFIPLFAIGLFLIILGITLEFPKFLTRESFSWIIYSLGIDTILLSTLLLLEEFDVFNTKKSFKLLFYYSYYSLTIYLAHNLLFFLFFHQLNAYNIWFFAAAAFIFIGLILRAIYKIWEGSASIKIQVGRLSLGLTERVEERINNKYKSRDS